MKSFFLSRANVQDGHFSLHEAAINGDAAAVEAVIVAGPELTKVEDSVRHLCAKLLIFENF